MGVWNVSLWETCNFNITLCTVCLNLCQIGMIILLIVLWVILYPDL